MLLWNAFKGINIISSWSFPLPPCPLLSSTPTTSHTTEPTFNLLPIAGVLSRRFLRTLSPITHVLVPATYSLFSKLLPSAVFQSTAVKYPSVTPEIEVCTFLFIYFATTELILSGATALIPATLSSIVSTSFIVK